jgi:isopenicillin N synthase-like dioxygenase
MHTAALLPLVDISPFLSTSPPDEEGKERTAKQIFDACSTVGFFYLVNHGIPASITDSVLSLGKEFFLNTSLEEKTRIIRQKVGEGHGDGARGWQPLRDNVTRGKRDWQEAVDFYREHDDASAGSSGNCPPYEILMGKNLWPQRPEDLKDTYEDYIERMLELGNAVLRAMSAALQVGDEHLFIQSTKKSFWGMRLIGYIPIPDAENAASEDADDDDGISCGEHTDYGCVTLLLTDSIKGALQVRPQGQLDSWINADPVPGAFVVNIGDMMERWTNGLWRSTSHRVVHRGQEFRTSVPFFYEPDFEARFVKSCTLVGFTWRELC